MLSGSQAVKNCLSFNRVHYSRRHKMIVVNFLFTNSRESWNPSLDSVLLCLRSHEVFK